MGGWQDDCAVHISRERTLGQLQQHHLIQEHPEFPLVRTSQAVPVRPPWYLTPGRVTAITLLAGVEPLLTASSTATRDILSGWSIGGAVDAGQ